MGLYGSSVISGPGQQLSLLPVIDMTGGLNLQRGGLQLLDSESPDMLNVDSQVAGGVCRRRGVTTGIGAALPSPICQVSWFENQVSTTQLIIVPLEDNTIWEIVAPGVGSPTIIPNWVRLPSWHPDQLSALHLLSDPGRQRLRRRDDHRLPLGHHSSHPGPRRGRVPSSQVHDYALGFRLGSARPGAW